MENNNLGKDIIVCEDVHNWYGNFPCTERDFNYGKERESFVVIGPFRSEVNLDPHAEPSGGTPAG
jgi:hypothetical protein